MKRRHAMATIGAVLAGCDMSRYDLETWGDAERDQFTTEAEYQDYINRWSGHVPKGARFVRWGDTIRVVGSTTVGVFGQTSFQTTQVQLPAPVECLIALQIDWVTKPNNDPIDAVELECSVGVGASNRTFRLAWTFAPAPSAPVLYQFREPVQVFSARGIMFGQGELKLSAHLSTLVPVSPR